MTTTGYDESPTLRPEETIPDRWIILVAPNVSGQMGGEAIKSLQIFQDLKNLNPNVIQITHGRNVAEAERLKLNSVYFVHDDFIMICLWRSVVGRWLLDYWFMRQAIRLAHRLVPEDHIGDVIIHQTGPNSPVLPRSLSNKYINVIGPINGNIYYPEYFRKFESLRTRTRRVFHLHIQRLNRFLPRGLKAAQQILVAGGDRTSSSLRAAGCRRTILKATLDCGVKDQILARPRITHRTPNLRFVHFGRLVFQKGTALAIRSLTKTHMPVHLDVIGRGPELSECQRLVRAHGLQDRVNFLDWHDHDELLDILANYRGMILPSIEDSNGIVVQEAMALGLPPICLDWGGPALLIEHGRTGFLIPPHDEEQIISQLAESLDTLAGNCGLAEDISIRARQTAENWRWSSLSRAWLDGYPSAKAAV
ncbi:glycosyltransferase [Methylobacterium sp. NEAU 140]|uniref:glycosyltransferase family 4 protein n=1 Tax=Methylobacterium sp. NEAU 140 TaxID=3064945 RepID=UPI0027372A88|nr:glycosyltransferase [Methylobacterium sp. NEAU 140]MDP4023745.1 glycosyltransferase [Methylobacterium sp. NEAU 140]